MSYGGNLYGTTSKGGTDNDGALYVLTAAGSKYTEQLLYSFENADDGGTPMGALVEYGGLLYGTAATGGSHANGTIFQVSSNGSNLCAFHTFGVQDDGKAPQAGLTLDSTSGSGVLYGTTSSGGPPKLDHGIVFSVNPGSCGPTNNYGDLHNFAGGSDGANPASTITLGSDGVIYGTTVFGGTGGCTQDKKQVGCGTIFQLKPTAKGTYKESILHSFGGQADGDGSYPYGGVLLTGNKKIYGVTSSGGPESIKTCNSSGGCGVVFEVK